ncbi:MAG: hypothetical protein AAGI67_07520 [Pseudomonadota bacterium]
MTLHQRIVVARAASFAYQDHEVHFEVLETLKGASAKTLSMPGVQVLDAQPSPFSSTAWLRRPNHETASDFSRAAPDNGCGTHGYVKNETYLLLLDPKKPTNPIMTLVGTRLREQVTWPGDLWIEAVMAYLAVAAADDPTAALERLRQRQLAEAPDSPLTADIVRHAQTPSLMKPLAVNLSLMETSVSHDLGSRALWAVLGQDPKLGAELVGELIASGRWTHFAEPVAAHAAKHQMVQHVGLFADAVLAHTDWRITNAAAGALHQLAVRRHTKQMVTVAAHRPSYAKWFSSWFERYPSGAARDLYRDLAARTPDDNWWIMLTLASLGDRDVLRRAIRMIRTGGIDPELKEHYLGGRWIPYEVVARSPLPEASREARRIIKQGPLEVQSWLAQGYLSSRSPWRWDRIADLVDRPDRDATLTQWIRRFLEANPNGGQGKQLLERL